MDSGGRELSSLNGLKSGIAELTRSAGVHLNDAFAPALARFARTKVRHMGRMVERSRGLRAGQGSAFAIAFIAAGWMYGAVAGGNGSAVVSGLASVVGLNASDIVITGQVETSEADVWEALGFQPGGSLVGFGVGEARARLLELPWVRDVAVRKLFPGTLQVALVEKRAVAVWQHNDRLTVVERSGAPIAKFGIGDLINNRFSHLPHLVGQGAAGRASDIIPVTAQYPSIAGRVQTYVRIADRRWDLMFANGLRVKLPEYRVDTALSRLADMEQETRLLEREIAVVDMRLDDRVTFRLEEDAAKTRAELVSARLKAMKKADLKL